MSERVLPGGFPDQTLTLQEAQYVLYRAGLNISREYIQEGLKQGLFPFGVAICMTHYKYIIYKKKLAEFIKDVTGNDAEL